MHQRIWIIKASITIVNVVIFDKAHCISQYLRNPLKFDSVFPFAIIRLQGQFKVVLLVGDPDLNPFLQITHRHPSSLSISNTATSL